MASSSVQLQGGSENPQGTDGKAFTRLIVADSQTIFRVGLRKIFALEDDIRVVGQAESYGQAISAIAKFSADVILFETTLAAEPAEAISELLRRAPHSKLIVLTAGATQDEVLEFLRRGAHGIIDRSIPPETLVACIRKVAKGDIWLDEQAVSWVLHAFRTSATRPMAPAAKVHLTQKEMMIVACVAQGMKNKEIAIRVNTTEQVVKNYLRKVYDKLGVSDRLELALYCLHHRLLDNTDAVPPLPEPAPVASASLNGSASQKEEEGEPVDPLAPVKV
ncbi:MAG TPA: response regulator transcription factor [Terriglobales bacterium]|jgi:two-component system, NarL family, nitrate/nitrite response regulator NarL|nr:response regulator transcription factor [Terriglobales bacterium]